MFIYSATSAKLGKHLCFPKVNNPWIVDSLKICRTKWTFCLLRWVGESAFEVKQYFKIDWDSKAWSFCKVQKWGTLDII